MTRSFTRGRAHERGFSLLIVLMAILVMAVAGAAAVSLGGSDAVAATGRTYRSQAIVAAETGLGVFSRTAIIDNINDDRTNAAAGQFGPAGNPAPTYYQLVDSDGDGAADLRYGYRVWGGGNAPLAQSRHVFAEGRVEELAAPNRVLGIAWLGTVLRQCGDPEGLQGMDGGGPAGAGAINERANNCNFASSSVMLGSGT